MLCRMNFNSLFTSKPMTGSDPAGSGCQVGCATCSPLNGCLSCKPRFFFHLELDGIQQRGTCMSSCPRGHYGMRSPHISTCIKCKVDCASCFSENFCTRCHPGHFLFRGKCESSCPNGLTANAALRECTVHCEVGEWTSWGQCVRKHNTTVHRRGEETRTRQILHFPSASGDPCPHISEIRKCEITCKLLNIKSCIAPFHFWGFGNISEK
uniref:R-spondin Fu-CRD domain-containing protein n=1 Tax=Xiphophorus couchianus TaxID=32473 RepID=A0A3B5LGN2_9TELE